VRHATLAPPSADRWLTAKTGLALVLANARYWPTVAPIVRAQLYRWERRAREIHNPFPRALALEKLRNEGFTAEVAATLATLAPRKHREHAVEAIVALEVMFDYLDGLTEQHNPDPLPNGLQLFQAFVDVVTPHAELDTSYYHYHPSAEDGGYLRELTVAARDKLAGLPAATAVVTAAQRAAMRCAEAQTRAHAASHLGTAQVEEWAMREAASTTLEWREFLAGAASSVLAVHALIAVAADERTTPEQAAAIDALYLSIAVLSTMFDSLVDYEHDLSVNTQGYIRYYQDSDLLAHRLVSVIHHAAMQARSLANGPHHIMTLAGVVAYYTSAPTATDRFAAPVTARIHRELQPLITPTLAVMRAWRLAKRLH
jgi:tetraprenyl-beta-curcumene synthase